MLVSGFNNNFALSVLHDVEKVGRTKPVNDMVEHFFKNRKTMRTNSRVYYNQPCLEK